MTHILQEYIDLKCQCLDHLEKNEEKNEIIRAILQSYSEDIKSRRATASVESGLGLIKLLEKRACLSYNDPEPLYSIAKQIDSKDLMEKILIYRNKVQNTNLQTDQSYYKLISQPDRSKDFGNNVKDDEDQNKVDDLIYEVVAESIGSTWKTMARYLKIQESVIDNLDRQYPTDTNSIIKEVFNKHRKKCPKYWISEVCKALEKSRRSDLRDAIEEITHQF